ncbi:MAG: DnaD domain protein [Anaeroplasmataceae bacterium]
MITIDKLDKFNIYASSSLSTDDYNSLSLLYQPLIGSQALFVYEALASLIERNGLRSESLYYVNLLDLLGLDEKTFNDSRLKLEAIGLMETFSNNDDYVLLLKIPLTPTQFLVDSVFGVYLKSKVGDKMFDYLTDHFKIEKFDRKGYKNITVSFNDVFESIDYNDTVKIDGVLLGRKPSGPIQMNNRNFDYNYFLSNIDKSFISYESLEGFKRTIINTSYVYGFNEDEMISLFDESINKTGLFDSKLLKKKANDRYNFKNNNKSPYLAQKDNDNSNSDSFIQVLASTPVKQILDTYWPGYPAIYLKTINDIYENIELDRGVITILIFSILKDKNGELPTLNYFKKVANTWIENGIYDVNAAWNYITRGKQANKEKTIDHPKANKTNVKTAGWVDENRRNLKEGFEMLNEQD